MALKKEKELNLTINRDALLKAMADVFKLELYTLEELEGVVYGGETLTFGEQVTKIIKEATDDYKAKDPENKESYSEAMNKLDANALYLYTSKYSFITESGAMDENYVYTDYTSDRGNIVLVTYTNEKDGKQVKFLLNYNIYTVEVKLGDTTYKLGKYDYVPIFE